MVRFHLFVTLGLRLLYSAANAALTDSLLHIVASNDCQNYIADIESLDIQNLLESFQVPIIRSTKIIANLANGQGYGCSFLVITHQSYESLAADYVNQFTTIFIIKEDINRGLEAKDGVIVPVVLMEDGQTMEVSCPGLQGSYHYITDWKTPPLELCQDLLTKSTVTVSATGIAPYVIRGNGSVSGVDMDIMNVIAAHMGIRYTNNVKKYT